jgi:hypothetical protein
MSVETTESVKVRDKHGNFLCPHGRIRHTCKACGGSSICEHGKQRHYCKECGGISICEHGKQRSICKKCGGGAICEHNRVRSACKDCGGSQICEHGRMRYGCKTCSPKGAYRMYQSSAKDRSHIFEILFDQYEDIVASPCRYCGAHSETNGTDQVVAGAGYTLANVVPCCTDCNKMKNDRTQAEFLAHCTRIAAFQSSSTLRRITMQMSKEQERQIKYLQYDIGRELIHAYGRNLLDPLCFQDSTPDDVIDNLQAALDALRRQTRLQEAVA